MDARDFLGYARELAGAYGPARRRTAISRAYYGAYHVAVELLLAVGVVIERGHGGHEAVRLRLRQSGLDPVIQAGAALQRLHDLRVKADYWLRDPHPEAPATVRQALAFGTLVVENLDRIAADPTLRARMTAALRAWEQR